MSTTPLLPEMDNLWPRGGMLALLSRRQPVSKRVEGGDRRDGGGGRREVRVKEERIYIEE